MKAGVPDLFLPVPRGEHHGLFIELKRRDGGRVSKEQKEWIASLQKQGYAACICAGWEEAADTLKQYLTKQNQSKAQRSGFALERTNSAASELLSLRGSETMPELVRTSAGWEDAAKVLTEYLGGK